MTADADTSPSRKPSRRGRPKESGLAERRRRQIIEAAYLLFAERGYAAASISELAKRSEMGEGTVYRYFASKREILDSVFDFVVEKIITIVQPQSLLLGAQSFDGLITQFSLISERLFALVENEPALLQLLLVEIGAIDIELKHRLLGLQRVVAGFLCRALETGISDGWVRQDIDPEVAAHTILMLMLPGLLQELRGYGTATNRDRYMRVVIGVISRALKPEDLR
ncbi:MAG: TetR/AcrR family transcriptional regulator [Mycobacteriaceae bacterium]